MCTTFACVGFMTRNGFPTISRFYSSLFHFLILGYMALTFDPWCWSGAELHVPVRFNYVIITRQGWTEYRQPQCNAEW